MLEPKHTACMEGATGRRLHCAHHCSRAVPHRAHRMGRWQHLIARGGASSSFHAGKAASAMGLAWHGEGDAQGQLARLPHVAHACTWSRQQADGSCTPPALGCAHPGHWPTQLAAACGYACHARATRVLQQGAYVHALRQARLVRQAGTCDVMRVGGSTMQHLLHASSARRTSLPLWQHARRRLHAASGPPQARTSTHSPACCSRGPMQATAWA